MSSKKILILHLSRLGDMMQSLPAVKLLKENNPESEITYFGIEEFCVLLKNIPWINTLVTIPQHEIKGVSTEDMDIDIEAFERLFRNIPELTAHYDVLINMTHNRGSSYLSQRINAAEKRGRIFSKENEIVMAGNWAKYLFAIARNRNDNLLNLVDLYIGMAGIQHGPVNGYLPTNPETDRQCLSRLKAYGFNPERTAVGFQLGASKSLRTWPPEYFLKLGEFLDSQLNAQIILFGSEQERALAAPFYKSAPFTFIDLIGRTTITDLPSFLKHIHVLVSNDTGPMHIAAAVGAKVVGIFMGTAYFRITGPYGAGHIAVQSNYPCAPCLDSTACAHPLCRTSISPELVLHGVKLALEHDVGSTAGSNGASIYISDFNGNGTMVYKRLDEKEEHFLPCLRSFHDARACISQSIWNEWLGLKQNLDMFTPIGDNGALADLLDDYKSAFLSFKRYYDQGREVCQNIVNEFRKASPRIEFIQEMIGKIEHVENEIKNLESPLAIFKAIHELYSAETEYCNFPKLAHLFYNKYNMLSETISSFDGWLHQINKTS